MIYLSITENMNSGGRQDLCNKNLFGLPFVLLLNWILESWETTNIFPIMNLRLGIWICWSIDKNGCIVTKNVFSMTLWLFKEEETNFFQCQHLILNEICPFLHMPYRRHNWPTNCVLPLCATNTMIVIIMAKLELMWLNCHTYGNTLIITNTTRSRNATIYFF
jgi:hypothetical protein